jgi:hypothetical protein
MILLLPIGILLTAALAIVILDRIQPKFGTSWLIASGAAIIGWLTIFVLRLRLPTTIQIISWSQPEIPLFGQISLLLDYNAWPYALALITITLAVILTDAARTRYDSTPLSWAASLMITALGLLALQSGTSLTLMITWVIVDILEMAYLLRLEEANRSYGRIVIAYGARTASIMMLFIATLVGWRASGQFDLTQIPQQAGFLFLLAAGLRLGVFPLNMPFLQEPNLRRGAGNIIRLAPVASSLSLLARLPANLVTPSLQRWLPYFLAMLAAAALYAGFRWLTATNEIAGRPFWIVAWAALATTSVLNGVPSASLAWGVALLLPGSLTFLYSPRIQRMNFLMFFGLLGLIGLPFTPAASGWMGLIGSGLTFWTFLFLIAHVMLILGYLNHALRPGGEVGALESWARLVYPLGLILIIQAIATMGLIGWPGSLTAGAWWLGIISLLLIIAAILTARRLGIRPPYLHLPASSPLTKVLDVILPIIEQVLRLDWLYQLIWQANHLIGLALKSFSAILESDGGILWTLLLLVLLISILTGGGVN